MTALVWYFAGVLIGLAVVLLAMEALPALREANRRLNADIAFLQAIPSNVEGEL